MTREEAIKYIKSRCIGSANERDGTQWSDAMWTAIEALQNLSKPNNGLQGSDLISRQDAIDAFGLSEKTRKYGGDHSGYDTMMLYEIQDVLESLPSADRPKNMIHIDDVYRLVAGHSDYHGDSILSAFTCLVEGKDVKPIAPLNESADIPTGKWIKSNLLPNGWHCSHCDAPVMTDDIDEMLFCPNCGAEMGVNK